MPRKPRNKNQRLDSEYEKKADRIAEGADVTTNEAVPQKDTESSESQTLEPYTVSLYSEYKTFIRAISYQERITQREVIEQAVNNFYDDSQRLREVARKFKRK
jgi:hypothetical protein